MQQIIYFLQLDRVIEIAGSNFPICGAQKPRANVHQKEDQSKHHVRFQSEKEEREECKAPDKQVESNARIVADTDSPLSSISGGRVGCRNLPFWHVEHTE